ncbi:uncharacterized protein LOC110006424 isoform X3 [Amborella trichopoda]|uniref:uncharacterized protein LOC110006424 isoform X3 n=1 Tax=Amborella trichopoda TaxID=13333 RepID=UPI0009BE84C9|nr:uncharacterized protein LOC110006424 isoform X3 [Amborella trichopoda]|eukprot:XP_020517462.1 uncharacterized protein LOC110006424 isoform X3 [Amborella trichopoda]
MDAVHNHGSKNHAKTFLEAENIEEDDEWVLLSQGKISSNEEDRFAESSDSSSSDSSSDDLELGFRGEPKMGQKVILEPSPAIPEPDCMADGHGYERPMLLRLTEGGHRASVKKVGDDSTQISRTSQKKWYSCICCCQFCFGEDKKHGYHQMETPKFCHDYH